MSAACLLLLLLGAPPFAAAQAAPGEPVPVLVELYTSEACSSCPTADAHLRDLALLQPVAGIRVVPLSLHVDYWNRLGWADPYSDRAFSARQMMYADANGRRYTPQMVVDGRRRFLGTSRTKARQALLTAATRPKRPVALAAERLPDGRLRISASVTGLPLDGPELLVHLALTQERVSSDVPGGENAGRRLEHAGLARRLATLGAVRGGTFHGETAWSVPRPLEDLSVVAFAQEAGGRKVVRALGVLPLATLTGGGLGR